jgi:hypothetical protein
MAPLAEGIGIEIRTFLQGAAWQGSTVYNRITHWEEATSTAGDTPVQGASKIGASA